MEIVTILELTNKFLINRAGPALAWSGSSVLEFGWEVCWKDLQREAHRQEPSRLVDETDAELTCTSDVFYLASYVQQDPVPLLAKWSHNPKITWLVCYLCVATVRGSNT